MNFESCLSKQEKLKTLLSSFKTPEELYEKIMQLGRELPPLDPALRIPKNLVSGCQSELYLDAELHQGKIQFTVYSEALISAGLAALLITIYNGEHPVALLQCPPRFIADIGLTHQLTPGRSQGLSSLFKHMQLRAIKLISQIIKN